MSTPDGPPNLIGTEQPSAKEVESAIYQLACMYLLHERKEETQLRFAFTALVQERHNRLHTNGTHKEGDGSSFEDCQNDICRNSTAILKMEREAKVELNNYTVQMLTEKYKIRHQKTQGKAFVELVEKESSLITPPDDSNLIIKV